MINLMTNQYVTDTVTLKWLTHRVANLKIFEKNIAAYLMASPQTLRKANLRDSIFFLKEMNTSGDSLCEVVPIPEQEKIKAKPE